MKNSITLLILLFCLPLFVPAQEEESEAPDYRMVELNYMKPKVGMEDKFVEAVKKHNAEYHDEESPYDATLFYVRAGEDAGWFVWAMGTMTFTDMDDAPGKGDHRDDWSKSVAPYVAQYGDIEFWRYNEALSSSDGDSEMMEILWFLDIKEGEYYRFKAFMEKTQKIFADKEEDAHIWMGRFTANDRDVAISFPFDQWSDLDEEDWSMKEAYDEEYGEGTWDNALEEWEDFVEGNSRQIWMTVPGS